MKLSIVIRVRGLWDREISRDENSIVKTFIQVCPNRSSHQYLLPSPRIPKSIKTISRWRESRRRVRI